MGLYLCVFADDDADEDLEGVEERVLELDGQVTVNSARMTQLGQASQAAPLLDKTGVRPVTPPSA